MDKPKHNEVMIVMIGNILHPFKKLVEKKPEE